MSFLVYAVSFVMKLCNPEGGMSECLDLFLCHYAEWLLNNHFHPFTIVNTYLPGSHLHQKMPSWLFICMSRKWFLKALYFWFLAVFPSLSPTIFSCIMVPTCCQGCLWSVPTGSSVILSSILFIPFLVLLMSTFLLSQVLKYFFLATELLSWLPSARSQLNSSAS